MNDQDKFAVWIADTILRVNDEEIFAETLQIQASQVETPEELDKILKDTDLGKPKPGDFGLEFIGSFMVMALVEFGRKLWDSYLDALAEEGGKELASITIDKIKPLLADTWGNKLAVISLDDAAARLREVAAKNGLRQEQTEKLIESLYSKEIRNEFT